MILGCPPTDQAVCAFLAEFKLAKGSFQDVAEALSKPAALRRVVGSNHVRGLVEETMASTWFTVQGMSTPTTSTRGTKAGDPLGDILFTMAVVQILEECAATLRALDLTEQVGYNAEYAPFGPLGGPSPWSSATSAMLMTTSS